MSFSNTRLYPLSGTSQCTGFVFAPSELSVYVVCNPNILEVSIGNGTVLRTGNLASYSQLTGYSINDCDIDLATGDLYVAGLGYEFNFQSQV